MVKIVVYDLLGREMRVLLNEEKAPGYYEIVLHAADPASRIYTILLQRRISPKAGE